MNGSAHPERLKNRQLAAKEPFFLGELCVEPALLTISTGGAAFRLEPRVMQVLSVLAAAGGEVVSKDALIEQCWGGRIVTDDSVQRCIAALRKAVAKVAPAPFVIETIPKIGYRLVVGAAAEPARHAPAPQPTGRDANGSGARPNAVDRALKTLRSEAPARLAGLVLAGLLMLTGSAFAIKRLSETGATPKVVVSTFEAVALSGEPGETLASVLQPAIAHQLGAVGVPILTANGGSARGKQTGATADYIIDGTVSPRADGFEIIARINGERSKEILWTKSFLIAPGNMERAPTEISAALGSALTGPVRLFGENRERADRLSAKLRISELLRERRVREALTEAERLLPLAQRDPTALALYSTAVAHGVVEAPLSERARLLREGRMAARRAIALDPRNGEAHYSLAILYQSTDYHRRLMTLNAGLEQDSRNPSLQRAMAAALTAVGRMAEAERWLLNSLAGDPFSRNAMQSLILLYADRQDAHALETALAEARSRWPNDRMFVDVELWIAARFLDAERLQRAIPGIAGLSAANLTRLQLAAAAIGSQSPESIDALADNCTGPQADGAAYGTICAYTLAKLDHADSALAALTIFLEDIAGPTQAEREARFLAHPWHQAKSAILFREPFANLRGDPRMWALFDQLGLTDYWLTSDAWPDFCSDARLPLDCAQMARDAVRSRSAITMLSRASGAR